MLRRSQRKERCAAEDENEEQRLRERQHAALRDLQLGTLARHVERDRADAHRKCGSVPAGDDR